MNETTAMPPYRQREVRSLKCINGETLNPEDVTTKELNPAYMFATAQRARSHSLRSLVKLS